MNSMISAEPLAESAPLHPLEKAGKIVGSQRRLATLLGVTKGAFGQWKLEGRNVPAEHCGAIERFTGGRVTCEALRPDVDWGIFRAPKADRRLRPVKAAPRIQPRPHRAIA